jgi:hypothetical protein
VIFNGTKVYCANAGDSRAMKCAIIPPEPGSLTRKSNIYLFNIIRALIGSNSLE